MPLFPFLSFLFFGNGMREEKKEGKALLFSDFFLLKENRGKGRRKEQEFLGSCSLIQRSSSISSFSAISFEK